MSYLLWITILGYSFTKVRSFQFTTHEGCLIKSFNRLLKMCWWYLRLSGRRDLWDVAHCSLVRVNTLMVETVSISETSANFYQTIRRNMMEDRNLHTKIISFITVTLKHDKSTVHLNSLTKTSALKPMTNTVILRQHFPNEVDYNSVLSTLSHKQPAGQPVCLPAHTNEG
jgi:hypothetical protein